MNNWGDLADGEVDEELEQCSGRRATFGGRERGEVCKVCGDSGAGRHYGSVCCSGCKGFFRRSVRFQKVYQCPYGQQCAISKMYRNCCRACRFQKCLYIGLDPKLVQGDWGQSKGKAKGLKNEPSPLRSRATSLSVQLQVGPAKCGDNCSMAAGLKVKEEPTEEQQVLTNGVRAEMESAGCSSLVMHDHTLHGVTVGRMALGALNSSRLSVGDGSDCFALADYLVSVERFCDNFVDQSGRSFLQCDLNIPLELAFQQPGLVASRSPVRWTPAHLEKGGAVFAGLFSRLLVHVLDWASHLPELGQFSDQDRKLLLRRRLMRSMWFMIAQRSVPFVWSSAQGMVVGQNYYYPRDPALQAQLDPSIRGLLGDACSMAYDEMVLPMREQHVSEAESALLRAICFFAPVARLSPEGHRLVVSTQNKYLGALTALVKQRCADGQSPMERMARLLMLPTSLEQVARIGEDAFSMYFAFSMNEMRAQLNYELHMRA